jgi:hypothetical protein
MATKTLVQQPVKKTDLKDVHLYLGAAGEKTWSALYVPKDATGAAIGEPRSITGVVTQDPGLWAWVDGVVVPAINAVEGT